MIEEIGEIVYTLVIGYIGALELCFVAKHIYHLSHHNLYPESEETRLKELEDLQKQLKKAVVESEEKQVDETIYLATKVDKAEHNDDYKTNTEENTLRRTKRQINSSLPIQQSSDESNNDFAIEENITNNENLAMNSNEMELILDKKEIIVEQIEQQIKEENISNNHNLAMNSNEMELLLDKKETIVEQIEQQIEEDIITPTIIGNHESQKTNLESIQNQINTNEQLNKNNEDFNQMDTNVKENIIDLNKGNIVSDSFAESNEIIAKSEELSDVQINEINKKILPENTDEMVSSMQRLNENLENKGSKSELIRADIYSSIIVNNDSLTDIKLDDKNEVTNESSDYISKNTENINSEKHLNLDDSSSQISSTLNLDEDLSRAIIVTDEVVSLTEISNEKRKLSEQSENITSVPEIDTLSKSFAVHSSSEDQLENQETSAVQPQLSESHILDYPVLESSSESSADEEENSIASVIEKKASTEESISQSQIVLTEEEKEKVLNAKDDEIKFKNLSEVLKSAEIIEENIVETPLEEDVYSEDIVPEEEKAQNIDNFPENYDEEIAFDDTDFDISMNKPLRRSPRMIQIDHYEEQWKSEENEMRRSSSEEDVSYERGKLNLDISRDIINNEETSTPTIELYDESGQKSPTINFEPNVRSAEVLSPSVLLEGISDFFDFNASINPSRSRSVSRSTSVQPAESFSGPSSRISSPEILHRTEEKPYPNSQPKNVEYQRDYNNFRVNLKKKKYTGTLRYSNDEQEPPRAKSPYLNFIFKEINMLSDMSVCPSPSEKLENKLQIYHDESNSSEHFDLIMSDQKFARSNYVGESTDYSYDFEDLREEARNFVRSRSPSISFEGDLKSLSIGEYRKKVQDDILNELQDKSLNYDNLSSGMNTSFWERERRESDSALIKNTEIVFQIQDEADFSISPNEGDGAFVEEVEVEPEEYHHFRRFSLQQEYQIEEYPNNDFANLNENYLEDKTITLENISSDPIESNEVILKAIKEHTRTINGDREIERNTEEIKNVDLLQNDQLIEDDLEQVDLKYVPKKEYNWRKNFKIDDDDHEILVAGTTTIAKEIENKDKLISLNSIELNSSNFDKDASPDFLENKLQENKFDAVYFQEKEEAAVQILGVLKENIYSKFNSNLVEEILSPKLEVSDVESDHENSFEENINNQVEEKDIEEETFHTTTTINSNINMENENNSNLGYNDSDTIGDADDGIDEVIYDYNERPDESYNQSEYGENNNNYDIGYDEPTNNEHHENLEPYNDLFDNSRSDGNIYNEEEYDSTNVSENQNTNNLNHDEHLLDSQSTEESVPTADVSTNGENVNLDRQFDKMYDDFIKIRRESRIEKDYNRIVERINTNYDDDTASITTDELIEQIYFKDLSPSRFERLGSEDSFCSNYSSLSQQSFGTRSKYKGISHARQIKSDRLRTRYGIAPAIGTFANFENTDDISVTYTPKKEYNWRKNFKLNEFDDIDIEKSKIRNKESIENSFEAVETSEKNKSRRKSDLTLQEQVIESDCTSQKINTKTDFELEKVLRTENVEGVLDERIDAMYDEVIKNRRKSKIEREFEKIAEDIETIPDEFYDFKSDPTNKILEDILSSSTDMNKNKKRIEDNFKEKISQEPEKLKKKIKKKIRKNSIINSKNENSEELSYSTESTEKKKKSSRKNSTISIHNNDADENEQLEPNKITKKIKKYKRQKSLDQTETLNLNLSENSNITLASCLENVPLDKIVEPISTPTESIAADEAAEKFSNSSVSNSSISLKSEDLKDQNDLISVSSQVRLDRIKENDILELIRDSSILGSSF